MANHKSSIKRARQTVARTLRRKSVRTRSQGTVRAFREALASGDKEKAREALDLATQVLRKAASRGVAHKRAASRRVSRLAQAFNKA